MSKDIKPQRVAFDYNKLAEAIVKAEQKVKVEENKIDDTAYFLKMLLIITFGLISLFIWVLFGTILYLVITGGIIAENFFESISMWTLVLASLVYAIASSVLTYKVSKIKDKIYLISYFGAITGLIALIVSALAYIKG